MIRMSEILWLCGISFAIGLIPFVVTLLFGVEIGLLAFGIIIGLIGFIVLSIVFEGNE